MSRGPGKTQVALKEALEAYPQHLISTEVLCWFVHDTESDDYDTSFAAFKKYLASDDTHWPWTRYDDINLRRSLRDLQKKGVVKCWGRGPVRGAYANRRRENLWSLPTCEGAKNSKYVLAYQPPRAKKQSPGEVLPGLDPSTA